MGLPFPDRRTRRGNRALILLLFTLVFAMEVAGVAIPPPGRDYVSTNLNIPGNQASPLGGGQSTQVLVTHLASAARLRALYSDVGFELAAVRSGNERVPSLILAQLPEDLDDIRDTTDRKDLFVRIVLPLILRQNALVLKRRQRLTRLIYQTAGELGQPDRQWLHRLAILYRVIRGDQGAGAVTEVRRMELLRRIDVVPVSLALAQAAAESGWGTSRFARRGNALFGQWTWGEEAGLVPRDRTKGLGHRVRAFQRLSGSVRTYIHNLNVSQHYAGFRTKRSILRRAGGPDGTWGRRLAGTLHAYSEEGPDYIRKIRVIIRANKFGDFETAIMSDQQTTAVTPSF